MCVIFFSLLLPSHKNLSLEQVIISASFCLFSLLLLIMVSKLVAFRSESAGSFPFEPCFEGGKGVLSNLEKTPPNWVRKSSGLLALLLLSGMRFSVSSDCSVGCISGDPPFLLFISRACLCLLSAPHCSPHLFCSERIQNDWAPEPRITSLAMERRVSQACQSLLRTIAVPA